MLNISYKCTADLDTIETYLKNPRAPSIKGRVWSKLEDLTLQNIMNGLKQSLAEGHDEANLIPETDNYHTIEFEVLKRLKGIEQIKRRCDFLGLDFGYITIVKNYNH